MAECKLETHLGYQQKKREVFVFVPQNSVMKRLWCSIGSGGIKGLLVFFWGGGGEGEGALAWLDRNPFKRDQPLDWHRVLASRFDVSRD